MQEGFDPHRRLSDEALMRSVREGDPVTQISKNQAREILFERYWLPLNHYLRRCGLPQHAAEDIAQNTLMKALLTDAARFRADEPTARFRAWLYRIAHNEAVNYLRRPAQQTQSLDLLVEQSSSEPWTADRFEQLEEEEFRHLMRNANLTSGEQALAWQFKDDHTRSAVEIAGRLQITAQAVYDRRLRIRSKLAAYLARTREYLIDKRAKKSLAPPPSLLNTGAGDSPAGDPQKEVI